MIICFCRPSRSLDASIAQTEKEHGCFVSLLLNRRTIPFAMISSAIPAVETHFVTSVAHETVRCLAQKISVELTLVCCCRVSPSLVAPVVEHLDEPGLLPEIRPQFGVPKATPQSEAHLDDGSRRLEGIVADGLCLYYCIPASDTRFCNKYCT